jgi:hypothetical protein
MMTRRMTGEITRGLILLLIFVFAVSSTTCANLVTLSYDDGRAEDGVWMDNLRGHAVVFTAPCDNWTLSEVAIYGGLAPEPKSEMFAVEVWDSNLSLLSKVTDRSMSFFGDNLTWAEIDIPDVKVSGSFIVSFYEFAGVYVGADLTVPYGRSAITARSPNRIMPWDVQNHSWNETNWMIRAAGYSPAPTIGLRMPFDKASQGSPARIELEAQDADGNLKSAALYIVDNKTGEIVWTEVKELKGKSAKAQFSWPGTMFQIVANGKAKGPVYAVNAAGIAENLSDLLAYSAPAVLELKKNSTGSVMAYFGSDGRLNALIDTYGGVHYLSQDVLGRTNPGVDYGQYSKNNITIIENSSKIWLLNVGIPTSQEDSGMTMVGPVVLSGSPIQNYGLKLQQAKVGMGEYVVLVEVQDSALNAVREVGEKTVKVT